MPHITRELLRRRAEHNEGMITTMEELTLHQEELEAINEVLGTTCRKLKILYLQNNIISKMQNLHHMKDLQYLNLALNNIEKIEGLGSCEFLNKLDLTINFIDFDTLEESIDHLKSRLHLKDLFLMGNPSQQKWGDSFKHYVVHHLPQLRCLDGVDITRSMRITAAQKAPQLEEELRRLAEETRERKAREAAEEGGEVVEEEEEVGEEPRVVEVDENGEELTKHNPQTRVKMYKEVAEQKAAKEARQKEMAPRERDYEAEQRERVADVRAREEEEGDQNKIRQCNEAKLDFRFDEEERPGFVVLDVSVPRHLDSSLIDVDVHPGWVSIVVKSKVLRLRLPAEVKAGETKAQRSKTTGHLVLFMPKINPKENMISLRAARREAAASKEKENDGSTTSAAPSAGEAGGRVRRRAAATSLADDMLRACQEANPSKAVNIRGIVRKAERQEEGAAARAFKEVSTVVYHGQAEPAGHGPPVAAAAPASALDDDDVPPLV